jgi:chromosome segregation ATPase
MTTEERFERIEHVTAGLAEQWKKDREENRQLWRDTQRQLNELAIRISEVDERLGKRIDQLSERMEELAEEAAVRDKESHERDRQLGARIEALVIAMGGFIAKQAKP